MTTIMTRADVVDCGARVTRQVSFLQGQRHSVRVVERIGGGDSFAAGLIHGFVSGRDLEATPRFAVAASALKQTIPEDLNQVSVAEVERLVNGDASGRVQG
jgi:2-dehydro-3-deoxygluconokinase